MTDSPSPRSLDLPDTVVPRPRSTQWDEGGGRFTPSGRLRVSAPLEAGDAFSRLQMGLARRGWQVERVAAEAGPADIVMVRSREAGLGKREAYRLNISAPGIRIEATSPAGWGHGVQTLLDLCDPQTGDWPVGSIVDAPRFAWRGMLLDCCRHFVSKAGVCRILDGMAACKLNRLHWHLTDDQAWRLEIKRYPRLTAIGASRPDESGGCRQYYTHEDICEIVGYAATLGIDIVPEIEMPGHATAALAAYPELGCRRDPLEVKAQWGLFPNNFNAGDERVFEFLENVLSEVMDLFPFPYVHLGADECDKAQWRACPDCQRRIKEEGLGDEDGLQSYFVNRIAVFLRRYGRTAIGWDEILEGDPLPGMLVQAWRDERIIKVAADRGFSVIASPRRYCYLDMSVSQVDLSDVRSFDPTQGLDETAAKMVVGAEAALWTEYLEESELEPMIFPRLWGLSEVLWCGPRDLTPFAEFKARVDRLTARARIDGLRPGPAMRDDLPAEKMRGRTDLDVPAPGVEKLA